MDDELGDLDEPAFHIWVQSIEDHLKVTHGAVIGLDGQTWNAGWGNP